MRCHGSGRPGLSPERDRSLGCNECRTVKDVVSRVIEKVMRGSIGGAGNARRESTGAGHGAGRGDARDQRPLPTGSQHTAPALYPTIGASQLRRPREGSRLGASPESACTSWVVERPGRYGNTTACPPQEAISAVSGSVSTE